ncbi:uncharacterized protein BO80DRAFT_504765 [Aspergillus ibericus CBS 121593]|uniref:Pre-rRNA processing protein n=1 Tax=Aspergillus ibericus CBS 121593 TaxID=1448316 RepID=A0A395GTH7_9EURO|nr:hypothetical protein BO80DRAFT_504765 [Aspergillus ibericus CBS 121593]RAK97393.1 hypothetical protein BO80DRAFT_504765 [Aspergillus ibericus CBS 121593]
MKTAFVFPEIPGGGYDRRYSNETKPKQTTSPTPPIFRYTKQPTNRPPYNQSTTHPPIQDSKMSQPQPPTPQAAQATHYLDLGITLAIHNWPALTLAVQSNWGGPTSSDKRDWLCGAISEMLTDRPETDAADLEDVLIQVMNDEFDVVVDDESAGNVADQIMEMKGQTVRGEFGEIQALWETWQSKKGKGDQGLGAFRRGEDQVDDESDDEEDEEEDVDGDMEMDDAPPALVRAPRERVEPEVDEDGFTTVVSKKKR